MLGPLAENQLAAWEELAEQLQTAQDRPVLRCGMCRAGVAILFDGNGAEYLYTHEQMLALKVLHLRNFHPALDPDPPGQQL